MSNKPITHQFKPTKSEPDVCAFIDGQSVCCLPFSDHEQPYPQVGDDWEFKLPYMKSKRVKQVGNIYKKEFIVERATAYPWKDKTAMLPYVSWKRENKGRYTGITVRQLMEFGRRISTKAERDARFAAHY